MSLRSLSTYSLASQVIGFGFHFLTAFILVRLLGKIEFGIFQQYNLLLTTILPFFGFTLVSSLYYFSSISDDSAEKSYFFNQTFVLLLLSSAFFAAISLLFKRPLLGFLNLGDLNEVAYWAIPAIALYLTASICDNIFLLDRNKLGILIFLPFEKLAFLAIVLSSYLYQGRFEDLFRGILFVSVLKFAFIALYLEKRHKLMGFRAVYQKTRNQIAYCWPFYLGIVVYVFSNKIDKFLLNGYVGPNDYAIYSVSFLSIPFLANAYSSVNNVALPEFVALIKRRDFSQLRLLYRNVVVKTSSIAIPLLFFFFYFGSYVIELVFTASYSEGVLYYKIGLFSFAGMLTSYGLILRAANLTKKIFLINLAAGTITVILAYLIIPSQLLLGAAITSVVAVLLPSFLQLYHEIKLTGYTFLEFFPWKEIGGIISISLLIFPINMVLEAFTPKNHLYPVLSALVFFPVAFYIFFRLKLLPFTDLLKLFQKG
jgi:O-antigen/teichoic acid export membrane protein